MHDDPYPTPFDTRPTHTSQVVVATQARGEFDPLNGALVWRVLLFLLAFYLTLALLFVFNTRIFAAPAVSTGAPAPACQLLAAH